MAAHGEPLAPKKRLDSWKEIAGFFGRDERTVKRWEKERRLPVYRVPGSARGGVFAFAEELTEWLKTPTHSLESGEVVAAKRVREDGASARAAAHPGPVEVPVVVNSPRRLQRFYEIGPRKSLSQL